MEKQAEDFLNKIFKYLENNKIDIKNWEIDHLCYRTSSLENYSKTKENFESFGTCLIESEVNGRQIATYKLEKPLFYKNWIIDLIEVPAPKPHKETREGFEHIEVVIDQNFDDFISHHSHLSFNKKGLLKELNPELEIEFNDCAVKFHHKSLEHIINIEKNPLILNFLDKTNILEKLRNYNPCLSGTLPLNIAHSSSDLDILFSSKDLNQFSAEAEKLFHEEERFSLKEGNFQNLKTILVNFYFEGLNIELFCQDRNVFKQQANQHFLIEGRLLKVLGLDFKKKITDLKKSGVKTEPAFGELLNLKNPYQELIELNNLSDLELFHKFGQKP